jgi:hypothetical protein
MRVSKVFTGGAGSCSGNGYCGDTGGRQTFLPYGTVEKPGGYYPDTGRWAYVDSNNYNWPPTGYGYGFSRSHRMGTLLG